MRYDSEVPDTIIANDRSYAAILARRYFYDRSVTAETLVEVFGGTSDPVIAELLDLVAHEPSRTGMLGVRYDEYVKRYWPHVAAILEQLDRGEEGRLPARGRLSLLKIAGYVLFMLFVGAIAAGHVAKVVLHITATRRLGSLELFGEILGGILMSGLAVSLVFTVLHAIRLYRRERARRTG